MPVFSSFLAGRQPSCQKNYWVKGALFPARAGILGLSGDGVPLRYSLRQRWVLALDATYRHQANTLVTGHSRLDPSSTPIRLNSGASDAFGLAPAVEYNWKRTLGVLFGVRMIPIARNASVTISPALAINYVR
jgi:hypothetical protein